MAVQTITYDDKSYLNQNSDIADVNKVNDTDMNEIKSVVNNNALEVTNITGQILWTNPNPNSSFAGQTITLSSNDYDCYEIVFIRTATTQYNYFSGKILKGSTTVIKVMVGEEDNSYLQFRWRTVTPQSDTLLQISDGTGKIVNQNTNSIVNTSCIPIYVIGYKTDLFN